MYPYCSYSSYYSQERRIGMKERLWLTRKLLIRILVIMIFYLSILFSCAVALCWVGLFLMEWAKMKEPIGNWHFVFLALLVAGVAAIFITDALDDKLEKKRGTLCVP